MTLQIAPSLLAADPLALGQAVAAVEAAGAQLLHIDVMDGHFVPNLSMGPEVVKALARTSRCTLDVHLMVTEPERHVPTFLAAGAHMISFHPETTWHPHRLCEQIRRAGGKAGLALNPGSPLGLIEPLFEVMDFVLLMSVNPGFGGQSFLPHSLARLEQLVSLRHRSGCRFLIEVDGGVGLDNIAALAQAGAEIAVAGSSIFAAPDPAQALTRLLEAAGRSSHD